MNETNYTKHKYRVECRCGYKKTNNDSGMRSDVVLVKVRVCNKCCPECAGTPIQLCYDKNGNRCI